MVTRWTFLAAQNDIAPVRRIGMPRLPGMLCGGCSCHSDQAAVRRSAWPYQGATPTVDRIAKPSRIAGPRLYMCPDTRAHHRDHAATPAGMSLLFRHSAGNITAAAPAGIDNACAFSDASAADIRGYDWTGGRTGVAHVRPSHARSSKIASIHSGFATRRIDILEAQQKSSACGARCMRIEIADRAWPKCR